MEKKRRRGNEEKKKRETKEGRKERKGLLRRDSEVYGGEIDKGPTSSELP